MFYSGVLVDAWVKLEDRSGIEYEVVGNVVELSFGGQRGNFQIQAREDALEELVTKGAETLRAMRAGAAGE